MLVCLLVVSCETTTPPPVPSTEPSATPWRTDTALVTSVGSEPDTIDPQHASFPNEASIAGMLYEPLLRWDPATLALVPGAARALPSVSADGLIYTYELRDGLAYSDGSTLTAQRFVDAFRRLCDPRSGGDMSYLAFAIRGCRALNTADLARLPAADLDRARDAIGVAAPNDHTVRFTLDRRDVAFPQTTALWIGAPIRLEDLAPT